MWSWASLFDQRPLRTISFKWAAQPFWEASVNTSVLWIWGCIGAPAIRIWRFSHHLRWFRKSLLLESFCPVTGEISSVTLGTTEKASCVTFPEVLFFLRKLMSLWATWAFLESRLKTFWWKQSEFLTDQVSFGLEIPENSEDRSDSPENLVFCVGTNSDFWKLMSQPSSWTNFTKFSESLRHYSCVGDRRSQSSRYWWILRFLAWAMSFTSFTMRVNSRGAAATPKRSARNWKTPFFLFEISDIFEIVDELGHGNKRLLCLSRWPTPLFESTSW